MSVRFKEEQEAQTTSDETTYEYSDGVITVKTWKGEPLDSLSDNKRELIELDRKVYIARGGFTGAKKTEDKVVLWYYNKKESVNYAILFNEKTRFIDVVDAVFRLPPDAVVKADKIFHAIAGVKRNPTLSANFYVSTDSPLNVDSIATMLSWMAGMHAEEIPSLYFFHGWFLHEIRDESCTYIETIASEIGYRGTGVAMPKNGIWLWDARFHANKFTLVIACDEKELLDFLINDVEASKVAQDIAEALKYKVLGSHVECEIGGKILDKIRILFG